MYFDSLAELWAMGGHGPYVWAAYLIGVVTLAGMLLAPLQRRRRFLREQAQVARRQESVARRQESVARRQQGNVARGQQARPRS